MLRVTQLNRQLATLETRAIAAEAVLDGLVTAMIVVNATGHVVYMNAAAEQIITAGDGPTASCFVLDAVTPSAGKLLRQLVASALQVPRNVTASPGGVMRISRRRSPARRHA
jgi:nitrogen-specific signal transduction histidine kinase